MQHFYYFPNLNKRFCKARHSTLATIQLPAAHLRIVAIKFQHATYRLNLTISIAQQTRKT